MKNFRFQVFTKILKIWTIYLQTPLSGKGQDHRKGVETFLQQFRNIFETISNGLGVGTGIFFSIFLSINTPPRGAKRPWGAAEGGAGVFIDKNIEKRSLCPPQGHWKLFQKCFKIVAKMSHPLFLWSCPFPDLCMLS